MSLEEAVAEAIRHCSRNGVLAGFLSEHGSEVMNMLLDEWNLDEAKGVWYDEGWEEAWEKAEAKYQPVIAENQAVIAEKDRENQKLRRLLREAGIEPQLD
jgi:hypothetical protein